MKSIPKETLPADPREWINRLKIESTSEVPVPTTLMEQVLGQETAVALAKKAAEQKRHLLLIGEPGTGKSMIARAMAEILPPERQEDILVYHNNKNPNSPKVTHVQGGTGRAIVQKYRIKANRLNIFYRIVEWTTGLAAILGGLFLWFALDQGPLVFLFAVLLGLLFLYFASQRRPKTDLLVPKLLIEHSAKPERAPYVDGTGSHAGALLGDIRHDPFQSGGLETPPHLRVEEGAIHRAHRGVLFIDEINVLRLPSQQALLTALQERKYSIVGQSQSSSGAMVRTESVPCDFILVAAGNLDAVQPASEEHAGGMHPALRSRIRGYGYEVYVNNMMQDTHENREKLVRFVAQEVVRDGKIPHFTTLAAAEIVREAQRRAGQAGKLTLRLRELGGLVRTAGDYARSAGAALVEPQHVAAARGSAKSLEQQIADHDIAHRMGETPIIASGWRIGTTYGLAAVGTGEVGEPAGLVVPVEAAVVAAKDRGGRVVLSKTLRKAADPGVEHVEGILTIIRKREIDGANLHLDALVRHPDADEEGIGLAAVVAAWSALEKVPTDQSVAMISSVTVAGGLRVCRATLQRVEAAAQLGFASVILPESCRETVLLDEDLRARISIQYCATLQDVLNVVTRRASSAEAKDPAAVVKVTAASSRRSGA